MTKPKKENDESMPDYDTPWVFTGQRIDRVIVALSRDRRGRVVDVTERARKELDEAKAKKETP